MAERSTAPTTFPTLSPTWPKTASPTIASEVVESAVTVVISRQWNNSGSNITELERAIEILLSQGYLFTADPYEPSGWGEIWAVVLCSLLLFVVPGILAISKYLKSQQEWQELTGGCFGKAKRLWMMFVRTLGVIFTSNQRRDEDLEQLGVEGASILYFERELGRLLLILAVIFNGVLVPVHFYFGGEGANLLGKGKGHRSDFIAWTIQNVPVNAVYPVLWLHIGFAFLATIVIFAYARRIKRGVEYIEDRYQNSTAHANDKTRLLEKDASLFVEGEVNFFPSSEQDLRRAFESVVPNQVDSIRIFEQRTRMKGLGEFRSVVTFKSPQYAREFLSFRLRKAAIKSRFTELMRSSATMTRHESPSTSEAGFEGEEVSQEDIALVENTSLSRVEFATTARRRRGDSAEPQDGLENVRLRANSEITAQNLAFDDLKFLSAIRMERWTVRPAPDPEDIIWDALSVHKLSFLCRSWCVNIVLVVVLCIFTTPIAFIAFVSGIASPQIQNDIQSTYTLIVAELRLLSPALGDFLFGFLPQLLLVVFDAWLLFALSLASKVIEPHHTHSGREVSLFRKSFWFLLFNTLLLPSLALSSIGGFMGDLLRNEVSPFALLGRAFATSSGAFTVTFIATQTWVGASMDVTRLTERLYFMARGYARPWASAEERREARLAQFEFDYGTEYALALTMFSLCVVFATVAPPILIFGVSYFLVKQATDQHALRTLVAKQEIDRLPQAHVAHAALRHVAVSLILLQSSMFGFFSTEVCLPQARNATLAGVPCIANDYSGTLTVRASFGQLLALLICLVGTCVHATRSFITSRGIPSLQNSLVDLKSPSGVIRAKAQFNTEPSNDIESAPVAPADPMQENSSVVPAV